MKYTALILMLFLVNAGYSEKLKFSNNNEEVEITGNAQIDLVTGDIVVQTVGTHIITEQPPVIMGFFPDDYDISVNDSITASWTVANATSCTANVLSGAATNWNGNKSAIDGNRTQSGIQITSLPATLQLACQNTLGTVVKTFQLLQENTGSVSTPVISFFRVDGSSNSAVVTPPGAATVTWSSADTTSCNASSTGSVTGWGGALTVSGTKQITVSNNTQLTLTCNGAVKTVNITYSNVSGCSSSVYPPNLSATNMSYTVLNDGFSFGESTNTDVLVDVSKNRFAAISGFGTNKPNFRRRLDFVTPTANYNEAIQTTVSISECPGDFSNTATCVKTVFPFGDMKFSTNQSDNPADYCILNPAKTYYMNVVHSADPYNVPPSCTNQTVSTCALFYTETNIN